MYISEVCTNQTHTKPPICEFFQLIKTKYNGISKLDIIENLNHRMFPCVEPALTPIASRDSQLVSNYIRNSPAQLTTGMQHTSAAQKLEFCTSVLHGDPDPLCTFVPSFDTTRYKTTGFYLFIFIYLSRRISVFFSFALQRSWRYGSWEGFTL